MLLEQLREGRETKAEGCLAGAVSSLERCSSPTETGRLAGPGGSWGDKVSFLGQPAKHPAVQGRQTGPL